VLSVILINTVYDLQEDMLHLSLKATTALVMLLFAKHTDCAVLDDRI